MQCADCEAEPVTHLSVQNGVTLCEECAEYHETNLQRETQSWVRPLSSETWREDQLIALFNGGNKRLNDFLSLTEVFLSSAEKYGSKAAVHYRKHSHEAKIPMMPTDFEVLEDGEEVKAAPELIKLMSPPTNTDRFLYFCKDTKERFDKLELGKKTKEIFEGTSKAMSEEYHKLRES